jgi:2-aminoadipate transaminase
MAAIDKVVFVPGDPFYVRGLRHNTLRLNFSCSDVDTIDLGIGRLGKAIRKLMETVTGPGLSVDREEHAPTEASR